MRPDLIRDLFEKEKSYWWHVCRREMVSSLLAEQNPGTLGLGVDVGCGTGYTATVFESKWRMVGVDLSSEALQFCRSRGLRRLCQVDVAGFSLPFKNESFDLVLALDVIEHVEDDIHALTECRRILRAGGTLVVTVPAFMALWSPWDESLGHKRRYTLAELVGAFRRAGLSVKKSTYIFFLVFPMASLIRRAKWLIQKDPASYSSDFIPLPRVLNSLLLRTGRLEQWLFFKLNLHFPFGLSVISIAMKEYPSTSHS
jgi:SAM-dependent methyltransferase